MVSTSFIILVSLLGFSSVYSNIADFDCFERHDIGPGRALFEVYTWNPRDKTCTKFYYGGLLGNRNRFETIEECRQSCRDAVLRDQLNFKSNRRYSAVNRLHEAIQIALNIEQVENGYFKLTSASEAKVIGVNTQNDTPTLEMQERNNDETQQWDIIPTGEKGYYRIKTRSRVAGHMDYMFLQVADNGANTVDLARRDNDNLGQQWRFV